MLICTVWMLSYLLTKHIFNYYDFPLHEIIFWYLAKYITIVNILGSNKRTSDENTTTALRSIIICMVIAKTPTIKKIHSTYEKVEKYFFHYHSFLSAQNF